jgi:serpin B
MIKKALYITIVAALASCGTSKNGTSTPGNDSALFWGELLNEAEKQTEKENICLSPMSAQLMMAMVANGAEGKTKQEICNAMQLGDDANARYRELLDNLENKHCEVKAANSIWIKEKFDVKQEFVDTNKVYLDALVERVEFNDETVERINNWCKENTNGKIPSIIERFNGSDRMVLLNALYFNGKWN